MAEHRISHPKPTPRNVDKCEGLSLVTKSCALLLLSGDIVPLYRQLGQADGVHVMTVHVE